MFKKSAAAFVKEWEATDLQEIMRKLLVPTVTTVAESNELAARLPVRRKAVFDGK